VNPSSATNRYIAQIFHSLNETTVRFFLTNLKLNLHYLPSYIIKGPPLFSQAEINSCEQGLISSLTIATFTSHVSSKLNRSFALLRNLKCLPFISIIISQIATGVKSNRSVSVGNRTTSVWWWLPIPTLTGALLRLIHIIMTILLC